MWKLGPVALVAYLLAGGGPSAATQEGGQPVEATSLLGEPLSRPALDPEFEAKQEALLAEARAARTRDPADADALIWVGRRLGYLGRYREAIATFERGAERFPGDARFPRHLGHRLITTRRLDEAVAALERAAALCAGKPDEIEPDGLPNAAGVPTSTLKGNVWYHLGLAHYLKGDYVAAESAYHAAWGLAANPDSLVASAYWLYLCRARSGDHAHAVEALAPVTADLEVIENRAYHRLVLAFKTSGELAPLLAEAREAGGVEFGTVGYGVAAELLVRGETKAGRALLREIVETSPAWASFGTIAAEADLAR